MVLNCQQSALKELDRLSNSNVHSILICGPAGCGKTYLAKQYQLMIKADDIIVVNASVSNIRDVLQALLDIRECVVVCIENLDLATTAAAQVILKNLEEPTPNVYFIITCRNLKRIPATIISRSVCVNVNLPSRDDIMSYADSQDRTQSLMLRDQPIWRCVKAFSDIDVIFRMTIEQRDYIENIMSLLSSEKSINDMQWSITHYSDNSVLPVDIAIRYIMYMTKSVYIKDQCLACLNSLDSGRVGVSAVISKFLLEMKYGG